MMIYLRAGFSLKSHLEQVRPLSLQADQASEAATANLRISTIFPSNSLDQTMQHIIVKLEQLKISCLTRSSFEDSFRLDISYYQK